jgi:hypothetical protein
MLTEVSKSDGNKQQYKLIRWQNRAVVQGHTAVAITTLCELVRNL